MNALNWLSLFVLIQSGVYLANCFQMGYTAQLDSLFNSNDLDYTCLHSDRDQQLLRVIKAEFIRNFPLFYRNVNELRKFIRFINEKLASQHTDCSLRKKKKLAKTSAYSRIPFKWG